MGAHPLHTDGPVELRAKTVRLSLTALVVSWLARKTARLAGLIVTSPAALVALGLAVGVRLAWLHAGRVPGLTTSSRAQA